MQQSQPIQPISTSMPPPPPPMAVAPPAKSGGSGLSKALSAAALALAVVALIVSIVMPGPTGSQGPAGADGQTGSAGPQGPPGPGTLLSWSNTSIAIAIVGCTNYASVTINVPSTGTVVVWAQIWLNIEHTSGQRDLVNAVLSTGPTGCGVGPYTAAVDVAAGEPTDSTFHQLFMQRPFAVAGAGSKTFYFNGDMTLGESVGDQFMYGNMIAVFYPS